MCFPKETGEGGRDGKQASKSIAPILQEVDPLQNGCNLEAYCTHKSIAPTKSSVTSKTWSRSPPIAPRPTDELPAGEHRCLFEKQCYVEQLAKQVFGRAVPDRDLDVTYSFW